MRTTSAAILLFMPFASAWLSTDLGKTSAAVHCLEQSTVPGPSCSALSAVHVDRDFDFDNSASPFQSNAKISPFWYHRYEEWKEFQSKHGHVHVGRGDNFALYLWVKAQREWYVNMKRLGQYHSEETTFQKVQLLHQMFKNTSAFIS